MEPAPPDADAPGALKRKRSPSITHSPTASTAAVGSAASAKAAMTSAQLSINYLARQSPEDLPLINKEDSLPGLLQLLTAYSNIVDRHESLASNLGARPLGPILIKRFERCFDAPPKIVASHHKGSLAGNPDGASQHSITWLEVIEFARAHPSQFTLSTFSEGRRVCQFYYPQKQLRVQISEEDFLFINSGRCQELIPPLPIWEDEEKEMATCDVLETRLKELTNAADMVAARTRQLSHRLKGRRNAILERRAEGGSGTPAKAPPSSASSGFVAVNSGPGRSASDGLEAGPNSSAAVRSELLRHFESLPHNQTSARTQSRQIPTSALLDATQPGERGGAERADTAAGGPTSTGSSMSPAPNSTFPFDSPPYPPPEYSISARGHTTQQQSTCLHRPSSSTGGGVPSTRTTTTTHTTLKHNFSRPLPPALESSQPFRPLCQAHMDSLPRGHRVIPPCDRCRRLRMDCVKNLTSCTGCTRKHARCHWRDVSRDEIGALDHLMDGGGDGRAAVGEASSVSPLQPSGTGMMANGFDARKAGDSDEDDEDEDDGNPLEDLEALGEKEDEEERERERLRQSAEEAEEEEGLRTVRHDWEESLRTLQHSHLLEVRHHADDAPGGLLDPQHHHSSSATAQSDDTKLSYETLATSVVSKVSSSEETTIAAIDHPVDEAPDASDPNGRPEDTSPTKDVTVPLYTGFRAVNDAMDEDPPPSAKPTGWRAM